MRLFPFYKIKIGTKWDKISSVWKQSQAKGFKAKDILFFLATDQKNISLFPFQPFAWYVLNEIQPQTKTSFVHEQLKYCWESNKMKEQCWQLLQKSNSIIPQVLLSYVARKYHV
jgi:hypothetical protein